MNSRRTRWLRAGFLGLWAAAMAMAGEPGELVAMTYNIRSAAGNGNLSILGHTLPHLVVRSRSGPDGLATVAAAHDVDLLGLQEVQGRSARSLGIDQPKHMANYLGMHHTFGTAKSGLGALADRTGNAILSRGAQTEKTRIKLGSGRQATMAVVEHPGFPQGLLFVVTHLMTGDNSDGRRDQLAQVVAKIEEFGLPTVFVGDFNAKPDSPEIQALVAGAYGVPFTDAYAAVNGDPGFTSPALGPHQRIDYLFVTPDIAVTSAQVLTGVASLSDHLPVVASLRFVGGYLELPTAEAEPPRAIGALFGMGD